MPKARKKLIVMGAGAFSRELLWVIGDVPEAARDWELAGLLDDQVDRSREGLARLGVRTPVLGAIKDWTPREDETFICGIGDPKTKLALCELLAERGAQFTSVVHPTAAVAPDTVVGTGVFLYRNVVVSVGARVGDHVHMNVAASFGHDAVAGDGCTINSHADVTGWVELGRGVYLGSHAVVLPRVHVGDFAIIGAGSVAIRRVPAHASVLGVPAKRIPSPAAAS